MISLRPHSYAFYVVQAVSLHAVTSSLSWRVMTVKHARRTAPQYVVRCQGGYPLAPLPSTTTLKAQLLPCFSAIHSNSGSVSAMADGRRRSSGGKIEGEQHCLAKWRIYDDGSFKSSFQWALLAHELPQNVGTSEWHRVGWRG